MINAKSYMTLRCLMGLGMGFALFFTFAATAQSQPSGYPSKPVRVIVPYPPGGGNDIIGRAIADELTRHYGQTFYVDNRPGASTIIGTEIAAHAPADGYHLFVASQTTFAIVPHLKSKVPYDPLLDFESISLLATQPYLIVNHPSLPARTVPELISLAKAKPGQLLFASPSIGTGGHLCAELFKVRADIQMVHIPYKGSGPAVADLIGGQIPLMFATTSSVHPHIKSGKLRGLAISSLIRHPTLADIPTIAETLPGFESIQWIGINTPRATPTPLIQTLNHSIASITHTPRFAQRMASQGYDAQGSTPEALSLRIKSEFIRFKKLIQSIGLKDEN